MEGSNVAEGGEELAADWLQKRGWQIVERNWTRKIGELDIVASRLVPWGDEEVVLFAFVEVKARIVSRGPPPEVRVDARKRSKIATLAKLYLAQRKIRRYVARFDVMGVDLDTGEVRHFPAAFDVSGRLR